MDLNLEDCVRTESMSDMGYRPGGAYDLRNSDDTHYPAQPHHQPQLQPPL